MPLNQVIPGLQGRCLKAESLRYCLPGFAACALLVPALQAQRPGTGWSDYLGGPDSSHYSPSKQITPANVDKLEIAWSYPVEEGGFYTFAPLVVDNVAYVSAKGGALVALDATTGKELWTHTFPGGTSNGIGVSGVRIIGKARIAPIVAFLSPLEGS
jgi:outer membrane protein assembly factor BamB